MNNNDFYTFGEYMKKDGSSLTASMEDYIEMIYRLSADNGFTRTHELSKALNIQSSSATKMVQRIAKMGYIRYEKYGYIMLEESGKKIGVWLIKRHKIIEDFMRMIGVNDSTVLEETEKTEHMLGVDTVSCIESLVKFLSNNPEIIKRYTDFRINPVK